uniref:Uracil-DNA glycosylase n=1 Tax=Marseillevirus LCMAC102 TaxID=2506603 RepID=A0A481YT92_9VIRU|nr:MAG: uracil-DNA glycosylase [Marseillevirus LCMAC102]
MSQTFLESDAQIIAVQYDCISLKAKNISADIAKKFPYANFYESSETTPKPGTIKLAGNKKKGERFVLAMFTQYYSGEPNDTDDSVEKREEWYLKCLDHIAKIKNLKSVTFSRDEHREVIVEWGKAQPNIKVDVLPSTLIEPDTVEIFPVCTEIDTRVVYHEWLRGIVDRILGTDSERIYDLLKKDENSSEEEFSYETMTLKKFTEKNIPEGWEEFFESILKNDGLDEISNYLKNEVEHGKIIYPPLAEIYSAFESCPLAETRVIIMGQDPYHTEKTAMGLAFGHHDERIKLQPSLRNIYKALEHDNFEPNWKSGDLSYWAVQGVFLVNTALTVRKGEAASHAQISKTKTGPWSYFINQLFRYLNEKCEHLVIIMWGEKAQEHSIFFDDKHFKISAPHPAASVYKPSNTEFFDHKPFSKTNKQLEKWGYEQIDWNLNNI